MIRLNKVQENWSNYDALLVKKAILLNKSPVINEFERTRFHEHLLKKFHDCFREIENMNTNPQASPKDIPEHLP
jgi:hypothetical protein